MVDPDSPEFDAVAAAKELDDLLGESAPSRPPADAGSDRYIATLEAEIEAMNALVAQKEQSLQRANQRARASARRDRGGGQADRDRGGEGARAAHAQAARELMACRR